MYSDLVSWRAYANERGNTAPAAASDTDASAALTRGSDYIRTRYVLRMGDVDVADPAIVEAAHIAAGYELATPGFWAKTYTANDAKVLTRVGEIAWTPTSGGMGGTDAFLPVSPAIDALLRPLGGYGAAVMVV